MAQVYKQRLVFFTPAHFEPWPLLLMPDRIDVRVRFASDEIFVLLRDAFSAVEAFAAEIGHFSEA
jgi:hypothetical protein